MNVPILPAPPDEDQGRDDEGQYDEFLNLNLDLNLPPRPDAGRKGAFFTFTSIFTCASPACASPARRDDCGTRRLPIVKSQDLTPLPQFSIPSVRR
jgi:hypothetical protein